MHSASTEVNVRAPNDEVGESSLFFASDEPSCIDYDDFDSSPGRGFHALREYGSPQLWNSFCLYCHLLRKIPNYCTESIRASVTSLLIFVIAA